MRRPSQIANMLLFAAVVVLGVALWRSKQAPAGKRTQVATQAASDFAPDVMAYMDGRHELQGMVVVTIDTEGGTGSISISRENTLSPAQLFAYTISEVHGVAANPGGTQTHIDHMPRPGEGGNHGYEVHNL